MLYLQLFAEKCRSYTFSRQKCHIFKFLQKRIMFLKYMTKIQCLALFLFRIRSINLFYLVSDGIKLSETTSSMSTTLSMQTVNVPLLEYFDVMFCIGCSLCDFDRKPSPLGKSSFLSQLLVSLGCRLKVQN